MHKHIQRGLLALAAGIVLACTGRLMVGGAGAHWRGGDQATAEAGLGPGTPAKEYIYAGSRLIAIEEAAGGGALAAPTDLEATGGPGALVNIEWSATPGAHHYQVERKDASGVLAVVTASATSNRFEDGGANGGSAYMYQVRAADAAGNLSPPSKTDLAVAVAFTDDPLQAQTQTTPGTKIKAEHLIQLRQAVNAVRSLAGLPDATWIHPDPASEPAQQRRKIFKADVLEMRLALDEALERLGIESTPYAPDLTTSSGGVVRAIHFQEIRDRVK